MKSVTSQNRPHCARAPMHMIKIQKFNAPALYSYQPPYRRMDFLLRLVDSATPMNFFEVKRHSKPKGKPWILRSLTISVFLVGIAIFVALFISQSSSYTTETEIKLSDISDNEWTCSMASVITQSISLDSTSEPSQYYNLMSVNELKSDCLKTLHSANPCAAGSAIMFRVGSTGIPQELEMVSSSAAAATIGDSFYFIVPAGTFGAPSVLRNLQSYKYNMSSGVLTQGILGFSQSFKYPSNKEQFASSSVAIDKHGNGLFLAYESEGYMMTYFNGEFAYRNPLQGDSVLLANDNHHNVYTLISEGSLLLSGVYTHQFSYYTVGSFSVEFIPQLLFSFQTDNNMTVLQMGIYCTFQPSDISSPPPVESIFLYYMAGSEDTENSLLGNLYVRNNGVSTLLFPSSRILTLQISAWENKVFFMYQNYSLVHGPNITRSRVFTYIATIDYKGLMKHCSTIYSEDGIYAFALVQNETQLIYTSVALNYLLFQRELYNSTVNVPLLSGFQGSTAGWFVCGDSLVTSGLPPDIYSDCASNGISWQLEYADAYFSTTDSFAQRAITQATQQCNASLYTAICDRVGALPPYICSRKVYLPFFTALATAIANAHLLTVVLFVLAGVVLSRTKKLREGPGAGAAVNPKNEGDIEINPMNLQRSSK